MQLLSLLTPLLAAALASAHGFVSEVTIDGKPYKGNSPGGPKNPSIVRQISDVGPVKGANNAAVNCGLDATTAASVADANPGSVLTFSWNGGDGSNWPHNTGPMLTYMASCGDTPCNKFDSQGARWFKIDQVGRKSNGKWAQEDLMNGATARVTLPRTLAAGNYLIRHEILALHLGTARGGAEFYPACAQLRVGGSQSGAPAPAELVALPGAYGDDDPGIFDREVFNPSARYVFPGPPVAKFVGAAGGSEDGGNGGNDGGDDTPAPAPAPTAPAPAKPKPTGSCKLKKRSVVAKRSTPRPRHLSRIMRGLTHGHSHGTPRI